MSATFAALGELGDAISFIFSERENQRVVSELGNHLRLASVDPGAPAPFFW